MATSSDRRDQIFDRPSEVIFEILIRRYIEFHANKTSCQKNFPDKIFKRGLQQSASVTGILRQVMVRSRGYGVALSLDGRWDRYRCPSPLRCCGVNNAHRKIALDEDSEFASVEKVLLAANGPTRLADELQKPTFRTALLCIPKNAR